MPENVEVTATEPMPDKGYLLLKATAVAADQGVFEAVISTATIDRELDIVEPQAMVDALQKWVALGKKVPLRWSHGTTPEFVVGHIDPESARVEDSEVIVSGFVDQETPLGKDAWRLVKSGTLGFSFGYLITDGVMRKGGGRHIRGMDVWEVTATSGPMNGDTRVTGWKSVDALQTELEQVKSQLAEANQELDGLKKQAEETDGPAVEPGVVDPLRKQLDDLELEFSQLDVERVKPPPQVKAVEPDGQPTLAELRRECHDLMLGQLSEGVETT